MTIDYKALAAKAAEHTDHTEVKAGGDFERTPIAAGKTIGRFIEYIELGVQPQGTYQGKEKPACATARFTFELLHPKKNIKEIEVDGSKVTVAERYSFNEAIKFGEKARFKKLLKAMTYGRKDITHFAQMLNEPFLLNFTHNEAEKDGKKVTYVNLYTDGIYGIEAPVVCTDALEGTTAPVPVGPALSPIKIFLWDLPSKETWDSLYIAGTRTVKDAKGNESEVSKNWLQDKILAAKDFTSSALEDLLTGSAALTEAVEKAEEKTTAKKSATVAETKSPSATQKQPSASPVSTTKSPSKAAPVVKKAGVTPKVAAAKSAKASAPDEAIDPLAALGL